jgi:hypothetical protein
MAAEDYIPFDWLSDHDIDECRIVKVKTLVHETELAYLFEDKRGKFWIPKSVCYFDKDMIRLTVDDWWHPTYINQ